MFLKSCAEQPKQLLHSRLAKFSWDSWTSQEDGESSEEDAGQSEPRLKSSTKPANRRYSNEVKQLHLFKQLPHIVKSCVDSDVVLLVSSTGSGKTQLVSPSTYFSKLTSVTQLPAIAMDTAIAQSVGDSICCRALISAPTVEACAANARRSKEV